MTTVPTTTGSPLGELLLEHAAFVQRHVVAQLDAYFAGTLTTFDIPLTPGGTEIQQRVWAELDAVEYGTSTTYGAITRALDLPRERVQAVGAAIGANPVLVVRPCHRVIGADGSMRGYAGGVDRKGQLLSLEGVLQPTLL